MITILISFVITFSVTFYKRRNGKDASYIVAAYIACCGGLVIAAMIPAKMFTEQTTSSISSLQDNSLSEGKFFLGIGQIEGRMKYVFYQQDGSVYNLKQVDYETASIRYTDGQPQINTLIKKPTKDLINLFSLRHRFEKCRYIIDVPKGTIKNNYNLDAQ